MAADQTGVASVYSTESGSKTASGEKLNPEALIAAHRTLPFGTTATVRNKRNGQSVDVLIKGIHDSHRRRLSVTSSAASGSVGSGGGRCDGA
jgi:rare lipoprotein A